MIHSFEGKSPRTDEAVFIAWNAEVIGSVDLGAQSSVWYSASIRGDVDHISVGPGSNVQDNAVLHVDAGIPLEIGRDVTIGHGAIVHGCTVGDTTLIGMGAVILNGATIGRECIVGAGALVAEGKSFPDRSIIVGSPARVVRSVTDEEVEKIRRNAENYCTRGRLHARATEHD